MASYKWFIRRLKAMNMPEVCWRLSQKLLQIKEEKKYKNQRLSVISTLFCKELKDLQLDSKRMCLNFHNWKYSLDTKIPLLGGYNYEDYKKNWDFGFQTEKVWPDIFSYHLKYKQRDDIGDARTNWELNRHFQLAILAKNYAATEDIKYLSELEDLFEDWNKKNPFLWGISWTSVMEIAIRCSNWCYIYCFLENKNIHRDFIEKLRIGILNMTSYIVKHYSRFSSANNHLIVEAYVIGQSGILFDYKPWINLAIKILSEEIVKQNYSDGVNKELSIHYQAFGMEAIGLLMRLLGKNGLKYPDSWSSMLDKMCCYVADCRGEYGEIISFGDDDEGKILDLHGGLDYYQYVLGLFSYLLDKQYVELKKAECENLNWLFSEEETKSVLKKQIYKKGLSACYKKGGNTIMRSKDQRILIGLDHAALGYGRIAAHGHADALSFQIFVEGMPLLIDPGTYIYHCDLDSRNAYRKTWNHNTVCINGMDQSEMLGAFLWGKRAESSLHEFEDEEKYTLLKASHNGYAPVKVYRTFIFDKKGKIQIKDEIITAEEKAANFLFGPEVIVELKDNTVNFALKNIQGRMTFESDESIITELETKMYSPTYGKQTKSCGISIQFRGNKLETNITIERSEGNNYEDSIA